MPVTTTHLSPAEVDALGASVHRVQINPADLAGMQVPFPTGLATTGAATTGASTMPAHLGTAVQYREIRRQSIEDQIADVVVDRMRPLVDEMVRQITSAVFTPLLAELRDMRGLNDIHRDHVAQRLERIETVLARHSSRGGFPEAPSSVLPGQTYAQCRVRVHHDLSTSLEGSNDGVTWVIVRPIGAVTPDGTGLMLANNAPAAATEWRHTEGPGASISNRTITGMTVVDDNGQPVAAPAAASDTREVPQPAPSSADPVGAAAAPAPAAGTAPSVDSPVPSAAGQPAVGPVGGGPAAVGAVPASAAVDAAPPMTLEALMTEMRRESTRLSVDRVRSWMAEHRWSRASDIPEAERQLAITALRALA